MSHSESEVTVTLQEEQHLRAGGEEGDILPRSQGAEPYPAAPTCPVHTRKHPTSPLLFSDLEVGWRPDRKEGPLILFFKEMHA